MQLPTAYKIATVFALVSFLPLIIAVPVNAQDQSIETVQALAESTDPERIRQAISLFQTFDLDDEENQLRLLRAYYSYYDELNERIPDRKADQKWACNEGYDFARSIKSQESTSGELAYYYAVLMGCRIRFKFFAKLRGPGAVLEALERARNLDPDVNYAGPARALGILYLELPPLFRDRERALELLKGAVERAPQRGGNRAWLAKALADNGCVSEAWQHIEFIRAQEYQVTSDHWRKIYTERIEELADNLQGKEDSDSCNVSA